MKNLKLAKIIQKAIIPALTIAIFAFSVKSFATPSPVEKNLKARAERIYQFDKNHPGKLPFRRVTALSIAMRFGDFSGAEKLIRELEPKAR